MTMMYQLDKNTRNGLANKMGLWLVIFSLFAFLAACGNEVNEGAEQSPDAHASGGNGEGAEMITVSHQLGETPVPKNPETVVVFDFGILDSLDALDVPVIGIPQANVPSY